MAKRDTSLFVRRDATFSPCRNYRYTLSIVWDESKPLAAFIGLNPSTADETQDDPTIRRCRGFAESWGCGGMVMLNLFAFRATDPEVMKRQMLPVGADNYLPALVRQCRITGPVVACWGTHGKHDGRANIVRFAWTKHPNLPQLQCLGKNADGSPRHPLYLAKDTKLELLEEIR